MNFTERRLEGCPFWLADTNTRIVQIGFCMHQTQIPCKAHRCIVTSFLSCVRCANRLRRHPKNHNSTRPLWGKENTAAHKAASAPSKREYRALLTDPPYLNLVGISTVSTQLSLCDGESPSGVPVLYLKAGVVCARNERECVRVRIGSDSCTCKK